jgi:hypothetical protein
MKYTATHVVIECILIKIKFWIQPHNAFNRSIKGIQSVLIREDLRPILCFCVSVVNISHNITDWLHQCTSIKKAPGATKTGSSLRGSLLMLRKLLFT